MNGLAIVRRTYARLRKPSQQALPWQTVVDAVADVLAIKRLDIELATHSSEGVTSAWFTPPSSDFALSAVGLTDVLLPTRLETRAADSTILPGGEVPSVDYGVLSTAPSGRCSFHGDPMRLTFNDTNDYVIAQRYRLIYEPDFPAAFALATDAHMPNFFIGMASLEVAYDLLDQIEDNSPGWDKFMAMASQRWPLQIEDKRRGWNAYVSAFRGRAAVPKRTLFSNMRRRPVTNLFKG